VLACPHCGQRLDLAPGSLRCGRGHAFDLARHGYAGLLPGDAHRGTADTSAMVAARHAFLGAGHYAPLSRAVARECARLLSGGPAGPVVDLGAGTGHHLARVLDRLPDRLGLALDLSSHALRRAARMHPRMGAALCDVWSSLPVRRGAAALVLSVLAPRNPEEMARALAPGGWLVVVTAGQGHLAELVEALGLLRVHADARQRLERRLAPSFAPERRGRLRLRMRLSRDEARLVAEMGPSARHADAASLAGRIEEIPSRVAVTAEFDISCHRRRGRHESGRS
jgi:23S rRNA (guanine745-N1)-methyltransferase